MSKRERPRHATALVAGILAWVIPGAGHVYLRRTARGLILCVCINGLFWAGVAFGGVFTVDPLRQPWWVPAQMGAGVSGLASWYRQQQYRQVVTDQIGIDPVPPREPRAARQWWDTYTEALAERGLALVYPTDSAARAYSGVAGMLNVMCVFDAVMLALLGKVGEPPPEPDTKKPKKEPPA